MGVLRDQRSRDKGRVSMNLAHQDNSNDIPYMGVDHGKYYINLTINQPIITFRTHSFTYLLCWHIKPLPHIIGTFTDCLCKMV